MPYLLRRPLLAGVLLFMGVLAGVRWHQGPPRPSPGDIALSADERPVVLRGRVMGPPQRSGRLISYVVRVDAWRTAPWGPFTPARGRVRVSVAGGLSGVDWGDEALFWGRLRPLRGPSVPGAYDEAAVLGGHGIFCRLSGKPAGVQMLRPAGPSAWLWWVVQARRRFARAFARLAPEARAIIEGLVLGERPSGFPALKEDFRRSGTIHLLVASGTNVAFVLSLWWVLGRWAFFLSRRVTLVLGVPLAFFYAFLAGADAPVMRAAVMSSAGLAGFLMGRVDRPAHLVGLAALVLLILEPRALFQAGFQMSFAATLGLALGMPAVEAVLRWCAGRPWWPKVRWAHLAFSGIIGLFAASALAQLSLAPLLIFYFRTFSFAGPITNMFAVPWGALCLFLGAGLFAWDLSGLPGAGLAAAATEHAALVLWKAAAWGARLPGAQVPMPWSGVQVAVLGAAVAAGLVVLAGVRWVEEEEGAAAFPIGRRRGWALAGVVLCAAFLIFVGRPRARRGPALLWPDGAGDAVLVQDAAGGATLLDPASPAQVQMTFTPFLRETGGTVRRLLFTRMPKKGEETLQAFAALCTDAEVTCAFQPPAASLCRALPGQWEEPALRWRREGRQGLSIAAGGKRFFFAANERAGLPPGPWDVVTLHPRGPGKDLKRRFPAGAASRWVLRGRGGMVWEDSLAGDVRRPSRDGYQLWREERWEGERRRRIW